LEQVREKARELEQSLLESEIKKQELEEEKDKTIWEYQKTQKVNKVIKQKGKRKSNVKFFFFFNIDIG
jgi:hypothetical protein